MPKGPLGARSQASVPEERPGVSSLLLVGVGSQKVELLEWC